MFIIVDKNNNIIRTQAKKPISYGNHLLLEVDSLPEKYDYLVVENIREVISDTGVYNTCDLVAKFKPQASEEHRLKVLAKQKAIKEIKELKQKLSDTDYQAIKYAEGFYTEEDYAPIKAQRQAWRDRINELEAIN